MERTLLLVDDEENILSALNRLFRREGYQIFRAVGGQAGLALLEQHEVGVIISDQRMPDMTGVEFLGRVKELYPDTVRIVLSGYTELSSIIDAINKGAIYRFLIKPWEDELLREQVREAFEFHEWRLANRRANHQLMETNQTLTTQVQQQHREVRSNQQALDTAHRILDEMPAAVMGISGDGDVALANREAIRVLGQHGNLLGEKAEHVLPPDLWTACQRLDDQQSESVTLRDHGRFELRCRHLGHQDRGMIVVLTEHRS